MSTRSSCAIRFALALVLSSAARAQQDAGEPALELAPLVPKPPWMMSAPPRQKQTDEKAAEKKKAAKKARKQKPAPAQDAEPKPGAPFVAAPPLAPLSLPEAGKAEAQKPAPEGELALPPLVPLAPDAAPLPLMLSNLGVLLQNDGGLPPVAAARVEEGLRAIAKIAPLTRGALLLKAPEKPCADDDCFASLASAQKVDQLLAALYARGGLEVRLLDVAAKKRISEAQQPGVSADPAEAAAWAQALACKLLVPAGCTGEATVDTGEGVTLELDGKPLARGEKRQLPVGVHQLRVRAKEKALQRPFPVLREGAPLLYARQVDGEPRLLTASEMMPPMGALASSAPAAKRTWAKPAGIAVLGVSAALAVAGAYFGAKSRSDLNKAESSFNSHGGAYLAGDLDALHSGNSKARSANGLFIASGVLLVTGALFTLAF
jgi:hypothetical protein